MERMEFANSSVLSGASYDQATGILTVSFKSGRSYDFYNVPVDVWNGFREAESKGRYFTRNIKGKYKPL